METGPIDLMRSYLTPEVIQKLSSFVGESTGSTQKAMEGIVPTIFAGLLNNASSPTGANRILSTITQGGHDGSILNNFSGLVGGSSMSGLLQSGQELLGGIFGNKLDSVVSLISSHSGVRESSASTLLSVAAPLVFGFLGKQVRSQGLNAWGLTSLLASHKSAIANLAPAGLTSLLGVSSLSKLGEVADTARATPPIAASEGRSALRRIAPLLLLALGALALVLYLRGRGESRPKMVRLTLPGGAVLTVPENTLDYNLAQFLATGNTSTLPRHFLCDHLNFDSNTTNLTPDSVDTVTGLVVILKAYPSTQIELDGYTDSTGNPDANKKLSLDRANVVKIMIVNAGVPGNRVSTAGYGADNPVASNDTEEGRARNRRTELVVSQM